MEVFPLFYFGPISYFAALRNSQHIIFDIYEHYYKQTYRNRMDIYTANGKMTLSIPVVKNRGKKTALKDVKISYDEDWQKHHWRSLFAAYSNSPFFLYYKDEIELLYQQKCSYLIDFNLKSHTIANSLLKAKHPHTFSKQYMEGANFEDFRNRFSAKSKKNKNCTIYPQVFEEKYGFISGLSILDLLFNEGNLAATYL